MQENRNKRQTGSKYESIAVQYLQEMGYDILERNYRNRNGEIDIIAAEGVFLIFVEVKYRGSSACGDPFEAVDFRKQKQICKTALYYYTRNGYSEDRPCRFDVIAIYSDGTIKQVKNAFDFHC